MRPITELLQLIRGRGGKVTPQRLAVYEALMADTSHPSAEAIHERVCRTMPTVSLATVYKTLNELVALGELRRFDIHGVSHFDTRTDSHAEVVCLSCDVIMDVPTSGTPLAPTIDDFEIVGQTQTFYGYCAACRAERSTA
jgi:Fur family transcriptional regulator, peroxide stress response regulator